MDLQRHRRYLRLNFGHLDAEIARLAAQLDEMLTQTHSAAPSMSRPELHQQIGNCRQHLKDLERLRLRALA